MTFYRVDFESEQLGQRGFVWFTSKAKAEAAGREWVGNDKEDGSFRIREIEIEPTKKGILDALNRYAEHPNNG